MGPPDFSFYPYNYLKGLGDSGNAPIGMQKY